MERKIGIWTGPTLVKEIAERLRAGGVTVVCVGTETVYVLARSSGVSGPDGAAWNAAVDYNRIIGHFPAAHHIRSNTRADGAA